MESKLNRLYLYQRRGISLEGAIQLIEEKLSKTKRVISKEVHQYYGYSLSYKIPMFDGHMVIFPIVDTFVELLLPARYTTNDFPDKQREVMQRLMYRNLLTASFLIELPDHLTEEERDYTIKLLGLSFPGYYSLVSDLPSNGLLDKEEHIYIETVTTDEFDLLDNIENIVLGHVKKK